MENDPHYFGNNFKENDPQTENGNISFISFYKLKVKFFLNLKCVQNLKKKMNCRYLYILSISKWVGCNTYYDKVGDFQELMNGRSFSI